MSYSFLILLLLSSAAVLWLRRLLHSLPPLYRLSQKGWLPLNPAAKERPLPLDQPRSGSLLSLADGSRWSWRLLDPRGSLALLLPEDPTDDLGHREFLSSRSQRQQGWHEAGQWLLRQLRQSFGIPYLDELLLQDLQSDPISDLEVYRPGQREALVELLSRAALKKRSAWILGLSDLQRELPEVDWEDLLRSRHLRLLGLFPYLDHSEAVGGLVAGWREPQLPPETEHLLRDVALSQETFLRLHRGGEELRLLNRDLREALDERQDLMKGLERQLQEQRRELEQWQVQALDANRLKSEFLSSMSHELRTPLNAIRGYSGIVIKEGGLNERQQVSLERVRSASGNLLKLINDILDYSRLEAGRMQHELEVLDGCALGRQVMSQLESLAEERGLSFRLETDEQQVFAVLDRGKAERILINLLGNAIKFTDQGEVRLRVLRREGMLIFEVRDTGVGINKEEQQAIFDSFRQGDGSARRHHGGTGLGLAITDKLVESLGGRIELESRPGEGSVFRVYLPIFLDLETAAGVLNAHAPREDAATPQSGIDPLSL